MNVVKTYIGLADFCLFFQEKFYQSLITTDVHSYIDAFMYICTF